MSQSDRMNQVNKQSIKAVEAEMDLVKEAYGIISPIPDRQNVYRGIATELLLARLNVLESHLTAIIYQQTAGKSSHR